MKQVRILILMLLSVILSCCGPKLEPTPTPPTPTPPEPVEKNYVTISDANFKSYILTNFDTDKDGGIDESEAQAIKKIECKDLGISSLDGIRCFTNLETLDCSGNKLESLVLCSAGKTKASVPEGNCSKLKAIECSGNKIASVEISACAALETFAASNNQLAEVDLSGNPALESVNVSGNTLTDIDLSGNPALESIDVSGNTLTDIDLSGNPALVDVDLSGNELTDIDLSSNPALESVNLSGNSLTSIDLSENPALVSLDVSDNSLTSIDLSENTNLQDLSVGNNELSELDLSGNPEISNVDCSGNSNLKEVTVPESSAVEVHSDEGVEKKESEVIAVTGVILDNTSLTLPEGESQTLVATVTPENATRKKVNWSSSDETVATVDKGGNVTAVMAGTATITATTVDGNKTATCAVTVNPKVYPVTDVTLDKITLTMTEGDTLALVATIAPENATNKDVTWSSSDGTVATVDHGGKVTAVTAGTATITVTTADGNKTATCAVTVNPKVYPVTGVSLDKITLTLTEGDTLALVATITPENATNKDVTWSSSDGTVATVDKSGKVTAVKAGTATITVTTLDGGFSATCKVTITSKTSGTGDDWHRE